MMSKRAALILIAPLALAACQKDAQPAADAQSTAETEVSTDAGSADQAMSGMAMASTTPAGRLVLPVIAGHPAAAYIMWKNGGSAPVTITGIAIEGAKKAEMHQTKGGAMLPLASLTLKPGEEADFAPGGRHIMVFGLPATVKPGDTLAYTLTLSDGTSVKGQFMAEKPGAEPMDGMHM